MKSKLLVSGNDGSKSYNAGDEYEGDGEWIRKMLVNGMADPLDDAASAIVANAYQKERYRSNALAASAKELRPDAAKPARKR